MDGYEETRQTRIYRSFSLEEHLKKERGLIDISTKLRFVEEGRKVL